MPSEAPALGNAQRRSATMVGKNVTIFALSRKSPEVGEDGREDQRSKRPDWSSHSLLELTVAADQVVGRTIMVELGLGVALELRDDALGQNLAEFDAPLIERVDVPDGALGKYAVLV